MNLSRFLGVGAIATIFVGAIWSAGCATKQCDHVETTSSATGELSYTEPGVAHEQRAKRLAADDGEEAEADRARGTERIVNEHRTFDSVYVDTSKILLMSTLKRDFTISGSIVSLPLSTFTLHFDRPTGEGTFALASLGAEICESVDFAASTDSTPSATDAGVTDASPEGDALPTGWSKICSRAEGTLTFAPSGSSALDGDITLSPTNADASGPSARGHAHFHYEETLRTETCPDIGRVPGVSP